MRIIQEHTEFFTFLKWWVSCSLSILHWGSSWLLWFLVMCFELVDQLIDWPHFIPLATLPITMEIYTWISYSSISNSEQLRDSALKIKSTKFNGLEMFYSTIHIFHLFCIFFNSFLKFLTYAHLYFITTKWLMDLGLNILKLLYFGPIPGTETLKPLEIPKQKSDKVSWCS